LLLLDEQLFAQTLSPHCPPEIKHTYSSCRLHTAYGRLASFVSTKDSLFSPFELSNAGLYNEAGAF